MSTIISLDEMLADLKRQSDARKVKHPYPGGWRTHCSPIGREDRAAWPLIRRLKKQIKRDLPAQEKPRKAMGSPMLAPQWKFGTEIYASPREILRVVFEGRKYASRSHVNFVWRRLCKERPIRVKRITRNRTYYHLNDYLVAWQNRNRRPGRRARTACASE